ncbi:MAG: VWA domain-containing protein [Candidatus Melainabacteria bacterium]|nr:VWA domain-containing protein [Candidatus Melainabacteria bacterium]
MNFIYPQALFLLILIPVYVLLHFYFDRKKKKDIIPFGNLEVLVEAISKTKKIDLLKHLPLILKTLVFFLLIFALARPTSTIYMPIRDTKVMLLIDISISMEASDIKPDRITAAKEAAKKFIHDLPRGIQVGIGLFSGNVRVLVNPTIDKSKVLHILNKLNAKNLEPGTAIGDAILAGTEAISFDDITSRNKLKNNRILVLITDGEANVGADPVFAAAQAKVNNITIQAIGIGNPLGTIIRGGILTRLDEYTLQEITSLTDGYYFNAQNLQDLNKIYKKIRKAIKLIPQETEITFIPLSAAFIVLIILQILKWSKFRFA